MALLDDVAGITKLAAASLDDIGAATAKAGSKAMGVVVDDAAVTPRYVVGFTPDRELPIVGKIALGSIKNKLIFLLPAALALSAFAPWAITPILMLGGAYLCFEGAEKVIEAFGGGHAETVAEVAVDAKTLEDQKVSGAIRTDLILSGEIMAIALADVATSPIVTQGVVLAAVGIAITIGVYGFVALIVKADDIGLHLATKPSRLAQAIGRGLVKFMPVLMKILSIVGTAAMIWVGGGILTHGLETSGVTAAPAHLIHDLAAHAATALQGVGGAASWIVTAGLNGLFGLVVGGVIALVVGMVHKARAPAHHASH